MQVHALDLADFCEEDYTLIGIHTTLEDCKLAYLINQKIKTNFSRASYSLDFENNKNNASYSVFSYESNKYDSDWFLIANSYTQEQKNVSDNVLFNSETTTYLIPEKKRVDFFIKIVGDTDYDFILKTVDSIKTIPQVIASYTIDAQTLKSKDYLIF